MINFDQANSNTGKTKKAFTLAEDIALIELKASGIAKATIAALVGHSEMSCQYRHAFLLTGKQWSAKLKAMVVKEGYVYSPEQIFKTHGATFEGPEQWDSIRDEFITKRTAELKSNEGAA